MASPEHRLERGGHEHRLERGGHLHGQGVEHHLDLHTLALDAPVERELPVPTIEMIKSRPIQHKVHWYKH